MLSKVPQAMGPQEDVLLGGGKLVLAVGVCLHGVAFKEFL